MGVLTGVRVVEIAGLGPAPFCGMLPADMDADVVLMEHAEARGGDPLALGKNAIVNRGKRSLALDPKDPAASASRFSATPSCESGPVPARGEHGAQILREAGLADHVIARLIPDVA